MSFTWTKRKGTGALGWKGAMESSYSVSDSEEELLTLERVSSDTQRGKKRRATKIEDTDGFADGV